MYFYIDSLGHKSDEYKIELDWSDAESTQVILLAKPEELMAISKLPNHYEGSLIYELTDSSGEGSAELEFSKYSRSIYWLLALEIKALTSDDRSSDENQSVKVSIEFSKSEGSDEVKYSYVLYLVIGIIITLTVIWFAILLAKCKGRLVLSRSNSMQLFPGLSSVVPVVDITTGISTDELDSSYPEIEIKNPTDFENHSCTICLENYKKLDKIRKLRCGHVFHKLCIDSWFLTNSYCCLCKRDCKPSEDSSHSGLDFSFGGDTIVAFDTEINTERALFEEDSEV